MVFYYIAGYQVGWYEQGLQKSERWYESTDWGRADDKHFDPFAPIVNREYLDKFPEYKYSAVNLYRGVDILKYLRYYDFYESFRLIYATDKFVATVSYVFHKFTSPFSLVVLSKCFREISLLSALKQPSVYSHSSAYR